jgi:hypothetical protein
MHMLLGCVGACYCACVCPCVIAWGRVCASMCVYVRAVHAFVSTCTPQSRGV